MKNSKRIIAIRAIVIFAIAVFALLIFFVLRSDNALLVHPKGIIAKSELHLMITNTLLMLLVIIPTAVLLIKTAWKYRAENVHAQYDPKKSLGILGQILLWLIPCLVILPMILITWNMTHSLDPYKPIQSEKKPLKIQVVALDWKWLFIYPEQKIATVNFVQFPARTPIHFELSADESPMNSFWIPQLAGQIYTMTGMITPLHLMADKPGEYRGRASEINGQGFADMTFIAKSCTQSDFDEWVQEVKKSPLRLSTAAYQDLIRPSQNHPVVLYSSVEDDLFCSIVMKPMVPHS